MWVVKIIYFIFSVKLRFVVNICNYFIVIIRYFKVIKNFFVGFRFMYSSVVKAIVSKS